jgi:hypothetical protein
VSPRQRKARKHPNQLGLSEKCWCRCVKFRGAHWVSRPCRGLPPSPGRAGQSHLVLRRRYKLPYLGEVGDPGLEPGEPGGGLEHGRFADFAITPPDRLRFARRSTSPFRGGMRSSLLRYSTKCDCPPWKGRVTMLHRLARALRCSNSHNTSRQSEAKARQGAKPWSVCLSSAQSRRSHGGCFP